MTELWPSGSLGMVEVTGLSLAILGADAAMKAASVEFAGMRKIGGGLVTIGFVGDLASVRTAVDAAARVCAECGSPAATSVIGRPAFPRHGTTLLAADES